MSGAPEDFGLEFLEWLRDETETEWSRTEAPDLKEFQRRGVGGTAWQPGTRWGRGLTDTEIAAAERTWHVVFPPDYRLFLQTLHAPDRRMFSARFDPNNRLVAGTTPSFFDWRTDEIEIAAAMTRLIDGIAFDVEHAELWLPGWGTKRDTAAARRERLGELIQRAPRLIPMRGHRFLLGEPIAAGNPVFSIHQSDLIVYGCDLRRFLLNELIGPPDHSKGTSIDLAAVPFWGELLG